MALDPATRTYLILQLTIGDDTTLDSDAAQFVTDLNNLIAAAYTTQTTEPAAALATALGRDLTTDDIHQINDMAYQRINAIINNALLQPPS